MGYGRKKKTQAQVHARRGEKVRPSDSPAWIEAVMLNISKGGIGLYAAEPLKHKGKVSIKITYMNEKNPVETEDIPGVVSWVQPVGSKFGAGVEFEAKVNGRTFPILSRCLEYARSNK